MAGDGGDDMSDGPTITFKVHLGRGAESRIELREGEAPVVQMPPPGRVPRVSKLMALAIKFDRLIRDGDVRDFAEIARLGHVTRARVTQIMNLLHLTPDIQEEILFLPRIQSGDDPIVERHLRPIVKLLDWPDQRRKWRELVAAAGAQPSR
jgi:hypothetical protein